jgi:hypothetical protein
LASGKLPPLWLTPKDHFTGPGIALRRAAYWKLKRLRHGIAQCKRCGSHERKWIAWQFLRLKSFANQCAEETMR